MGIAAYKLPSRVLRFLALTVFVVSILPARAQEPFIHSSDFYVTTSDNVSIHVHRKVASFDQFNFAFKRVPVLLIHGTWVDGRVWDFPGRSVMDHLAVQGYDVYALDLRGMGLSKGPSGQPNYASIDMFNRVNDVVAVARYILATTGRLPVAMGWSGGGVVTGLFAASHPELVAGVGFLSVARDGFVVPPGLMSVLASILGTASFQPNQAEVDAILFAINPITGQSTMSLDAENTFFSLTEPDSVKAVLQEVEICPGLPSLLVGTCAHPAWTAIKAPALVVDGALDVLVGAPRAKLLFDALGSTNKHFLVFPFNSHGWFLEDNHDETVEVFDAFLSQFGFSICLGSQCWSFNPPPLTSALFETALSE